MMNSKKLHLSFVHSSINVDIIKHVGTIDQ